MITQRPPQPWTFKLLAAALGIVIGLSLAWVETVTDAGTHQVPVAAIGFGHAKTISASRTEVAERGTDEEYATSDRESDSVVAIRRTTFNHRLRGRTGETPCPQCAVRLALRSASGDGPRVFAGTSGGATEAATLEGVRLTGSRAAASESSEADGTEGATAPRGGHRRSAAGRS